MCFVSKKLYTAFPFVVILFLLTSWPIYGKTEANLASAYKDYFSIGVALSKTDTQSEAVRRMVLDNFDSVTHEFAMKWSQVEVKQGIYDFSHIDSFVALNAGADKRIIGHTLVWHKANPDWLFKQEAIKPTAARDFYLDKLKTYIFTMMGRYRGKIYGWDVVNEAFNYDGSFRKSPWLDTIGEDYIEKAFEFAHQADPNAELYYNDYGLVNSKKQTAVAALVQRLKVKGIPIHAIGIQGHYSLTYPDLTKLDETIQRFAKLGVKVMITELDVSVLPFPGQEERGEDALISAERFTELNPYSEQLPDKIQQQHTNRYRDLFCVFLKHKNTVSRVTFWGLTDSRSWRNNWPLEGRTDYPLLYDRNLQPKPIVAELINLASSYKSACNPVRVYKE